MSPKSASARTPFGRLLGIVGGRAGVTLILVALGVAAGMFLAPVARTQGGTPPADAASAVRTGSGAVANGAAQTAGAGSAAASADEADATIRKVLEPLLGGRRIEEIRKTPLAGIYEARFRDPRMGHVMIYVDEQAKHMFYEGDLIEIAGLRNLTQERIEELMAIRFDELPLDLAVKQMAGAGTRRVAVFEDPNCGFCKRLRADLVKLDDITIYVFPMAFLAADSESKARKALCAADPAVAWNELLLQNRLPDNPGTCSTSIEKVRELAQSLGITGTPVVFFENGKRLSGYEPPERFNQRLAKNSKKS